MNFKFTPVTTPNVTTRTMRTRQEQVMQDLMQIELWDSLRQSGNKLFLPKTLPR